MFTVKLDKRADWRQYSGRCAKEFHQDSCLVDRVKVELLGPYDLNPRPRLTYRLKNLKETWNHESTHLLSNHIKVACPQSQKAV